MSGNVVPFRPRPAEPPAAGYDGLCCPNCGCAWFKLGAGFDEDFEYGVVALTKEGSVGGYSGTPHCMGCGREVLP